MKKKHILEGLESIEKKLQICRHFTEFDRTALISRNRGFEGRRGTHSTLFLRYL